MTETRPGLAWPRPTAQVAPYVEALGMEDAILFLLTFGGAELYVATNPTGRRQVEAMFGADKARALAAQAHRLPARVPLAKRWLALCLAAQGSSAAAIARTLRVTDVSVRKWLR
jgi:hypothetical protein